MICEVREEQSEVVLKNATFSDVLAVIFIWLHRDREIVFRKPEEENG